MSHSNRPDKGLQRQLQAMGFAFHGMTAQGHFRFLHASGGAIDRMQRPQRAGARVQVHAGGCSQGSSSLQSAQSIVTIEKGQNPNCGQL